MSTRLKHSPTLLSGAQAPFVALESTVISHGLPYPANLETALRLEEVVRAQGAIPATVGIISGEVVVGLDRGQIGDLASLRLRCEQITEALAAFRGRIQQVPPAYAAIRQEGRRLSELARRGIQVEAPARPVEIHALELVAWDSPYLTRNIVCSPGTNIRSLAHDPGQMLKAGGHWADLRRLASGSCHVQDAINLDDLRGAILSGHWLHLLHPIEAALKDFERVDLSAEMAMRVTQGQAIKLEPPPTTPLAHAHAPAGSLVAVLKPSRKRPSLWHPKKVFNS